MNQSLESQTQRSQESRQNLIRLKDKDLCFLIPNLFRAGFDRVRLHHALICREVALITEMQCFESIFQVLEYAEFEYSLSFQPGFRGSRIADPVGWLTAKIAGETYYFRPEGYIHQEEYFRIDHEFQKTWPKNLEHDFWEWNHQLTQERKDFFESAAAAHGVLTWDLTLDYYLRAYWLLYVKRI